MNRYATKFVDKEKWNQKFDVFLKCRAVVFIPYGELFSLSAISFFLILEEFANETLETLKIICGKVDSRL